MNTATKMPGFYSTTEVKKKIGLSAKELRDYTKYKLVYPTLKAGNGENNKYNYYDEAAVRKINIIKIYRDLDFPFKEIKKIFDDPLKSSFDIISDQIRLLEEKKKNIDLCIAMDNMILSYGLDPLVQNAGRTTDIFSGIEERKYKIKEAISARISALGNEKLMELYTELYEQLIRYEIYQRSGKNIESAETAALTESLLALLQKLFPVELTGTFVMNALALMRENEYSHKILTDITTEENLSYIHDSLFSYFLHRFEDNIVYPLAEKTYPLYESDSEASRTFSFYEQIKEEFHIFWISAYQMLGVANAESLLNFCWPVFFKVIPDHKEFSRKRKIKVKPQYENYYEMLFYFACRYFDENAAELGKEFYDLDKSFFDKTENCFDLAPGTCFTMEADQK